jgi:hypothetical protein
MEIVGPRSLVPSGRHPIIEALAPEVKSWFADTVAEPIPEELQLILRRIDTYAERTRLPAGLQVTGPASLTPIA